MTDPKATPPRSDPTATPDPESELAAWLVDELSGMRVSKVAPNPSRSNDLLQQARKHISSARLLADDDPTLALSACHDAVRKAVDADAGAIGYRFENTPGAHRTVLGYARSALSAAVATSDLEMSDRLRSRRHDAEYGRVPSAQVTAAEVLAFAEAAGRIVTAIIDRQIERRHPPSETGG